MDADPATSTRPRASRALRALFWVGLLVATASSGCLNAVDSYYAFDPDPQYVNPGVFVGNYSNSGTKTLEPGPYRPGPPEIVQLKSNRAAYFEGADGVTTDATALITMAIWKPECPGDGGDRVDDGQAQDPTAPMPGEGEEEPVEAEATLPCPPITGERIPIVIDAGPYFEIDQRCEIPSQDPCTVGYVKDTIATRGQTTQFSIDNFLSHGYAVVQLAVRGTGTSGGCMDLMGDDEVHDLDQALTWLGEQPWSNGRIGMQGVSYDGSTPWNAAATGNPYLKTIVPISGLPDIFDLMFHNGSAETRGAVMHSKDVYWSYGFSDGFLGLPQDTPVPVPIPIPIPVEPPGELYNPLNGQANGREQYQDLQNLLCPEAYNGQALGQASVATGARFAEIAAADPYWVERDHRDDILANYQGSVFLIHGLQDWNVDPHAAIPFNVALREKGLEMKEWYGQWGHARPDSTCSPTAPAWVSLPCRRDWGEVMLRWYDRYLKDDQTVDVGPSIQVQDNVGQWRNADSFPYAGDQWTRLHLTADNKLGAQATGSPTAIRLMPPTSGAPATIAELRGEPLAADLHISGMPQLDLPFQVIGQGGQIGAWLFDVDEEGNARAAGVANPDKGRWLPAGTPIIGHAQLNLLYHEGGETYVPVAPGQTYTARVEFEPMEALVPAGHHLMLWVFQFQYPEHYSSQTMAPVDIFLGGDGPVLRLPTPDVDPRTVFPVPGSHFPDRDLLSRMYVPLPVFTPSGPAPVGVPDGAQPTAHAACPVTTKLPTSVGQAAPTGACDAESW